MRLWVPAAFGAVVVVAYALFYALASLEQQGSTSLWLANVLGLLAVAVGLVAAGFILGRAAPP